MDEPNPTSSPYQPFRNLLLAAAILVYLGIVMGGIVRSTGSGGACAGWPMCGNSWLPPQELGGLIDWGHRLAALLVLPVLLAATVLAWRSYRRYPHLSLPVSGALGITSLQIFMGRELVILGGSTLGTAIHFGISLLVLGLLLAPLVLIFRLERSAGSEARQQLFNLGKWGKAGKGLVSLLAGSLAAREGDPLKRIAYRTRFARLSLLTLAVTLLLLVSGAVVSGTKSGTACPAWPMCTGGILPADAMGWIPMFHRLIVAGVGLLVGILVVQAWRTQRRETAILVATTTVAVLFFAQALMGGYQVLQGFPLYMMSLHEATAAAVWAAMVIQVAVVGIAGRTALAEQQDFESFGDRKGLLKDLLSLTKPVVVILLLVTTFTGMVIGAKAWPSWSLVFWTLLGGALAAGGSGAINQYIDRFDDVRMQRTELRPIPAGRLTPGEGLAFGVALCLASFYLTVAFVNLLAGLLVLAGIIYYVLIYSLLLKKTTVQNIVIGGGAGAIPPLVGWAAATGSLNVPSLFLFALVFLWTPPHFWALAIVRRNDYARAGVPMLPVVRGEKETRWQIFLYTAELVVLTLVFPLFGLGRGLYLVSAAALGGWLLLSAWRVWQQGGNKTAWKMYRYSSMYLAFIFFALMVDRLVF